MGGGGTVVNMTVRATDPNAFRKSMRQNISDAKRAARIGKR